MKKFFMTLVCFALVFVFLFNLASCSSPILAKDLMEEMEDRDIRPLAIDDAFVLSQLNFATSLLNAGHEKNENTLLSPFSATIALAMTAGGADGNTLREMEKVIGGGIEKERLNRYLHTYLELLDEEDEGLDWANSIWFRSGFQISSQFLQAGDDYFDADAFQGAFDQKTVEDINQWTRENTDGLIDEAISRIEPDDMLFLINTLVFNGTWAEKYKKSDLSTGTFHAENGDESAEMMTSTENIYLEDNGATGFIKRYQDSPFAFAALLPREGQSVEEYAGTLTGEKLKKILDKKTNKKISVTMPQFEIKFSKSLVASLQKMGMVDAFGDGADFSGITKDRELFLSEVLQKTYIKVDKDGTKAGALTITGVKEMSMEKEVQVVLDRPFIFMILDTNTNVPLFIGILNHIK